MLPRVCDCLRLIQTENNTMHEVAAHSLLFALVNHASGLVSGRDGGLAGRRVPNNEDATRAAAAHLVAARFTPGSYWVWQYKDHLGATSSYERYTVRAARDARLEIELATKFAANESYSAHHVMELDVGDALESRRVGRDGWALARFAYRDFADGTWRDAPHRDNVQAFEEKFAPWQMADALAASSPAVERVADEGVEVCERGLAVSPAGSGPTPLFRTGRTKYTGAWYVEPLASGAPRCWGVAGFKRFNEGRGEHEFTFELVEAGLEDLRLQ